MTHFPIKFGGVWLFPARCAGGRAGVQWGGAMALRMPGSSCGCDDPVGTIEAVMKGFGKRFGRALWVTAIVFVWTAGPWVPAAVCAFESIAAASAAVSSDCGKCAHAEKKAGPERDCCKRVLDSCCLSAPGTSGTPSASAQVEAPAIAAVPIVLAPSYTSHDSSSWISRDFVPRIPPASSVLRL